ncbi:hypothetical protein ABZ723_19735 [Streptomyces sp. NPDC006700]
MLRTLYEAAALTLFGYFSTTVFADRGGNGSTGPVRARSLVRL